jgi:biotin carboxylase
MSSRLLIVDAPGGPHPRFYLPPLVEEFEVAVVWLGVEPPAARHSRAAAFDGAQLCREVTDPEAVTDAALETARSFRPDGIVAFSERVVHDAQMVACEVGLPANSPQTLVALRDKRVQRRMLREYGLPGPRQWILADEDDCHRAAVEADFPAVLKPSVGMGSISTFRVERADQLTELWRTAMSLITTDNRIAHRSPVPLLEDELRSPEPVDSRGLASYLSVEAIINRGDVHVLAVSDKLPLAEPFRENGHLLPSARSEAELAAVLRCARDAHAALGIIHGATHTEIRLTGDGPRIIEVNGRIGGQVSEQLMCSAGYRFERELARSSAGITPETRIRFHMPSAYLTPQPPAGRHKVVRAPSPDEFRARVPGLASLYHLVQAGAVVDSMVGTAANLCRATVVGDSPQELLDLGIRLSSPEFFELCAEQPLASTVLDPA